MHQEGGRKKKKKSFGLFLVKTASELLAAFILYLSLIRERAKTLLISVRRFSYKVTTFIAVCVLMGHS